MADLFRFEIITPERKFYEGDASMVELTTTEGDIGIYRNHIPLTAVVAPGILKLHEDTGLKEAALTRQNFEENLFAFPIPCKDEC